MDDIRRRIEDKLAVTLYRLRLLGAAVEVLPGAIGGGFPFADEVDEIPGGENGELGFATRARLVTCANRLSAALDRLNDGTYGVCSECAERISPARLHAVPEVETCGGCQDGIERARWIELSD